MRKSKRRRTQQKGVIVHANKVSQSRSLQFMKSVTEDLERERGGINWQSNMQFTEVFKMSGQER